MLKPSAGALSNAGAPFTVFCPLIAGEFMFDCELTSLIDVEVASTLFVLKMAVESDVPTPLFGTVTDIVVDTSFVLIIVVVDNDDVEVEEDVNAITFVLCVVVNAAGVASLSVLPIFAVDVAMVTGATLISQSNTASVDIASLRKCTARTL